MLEQSITSPGCDLWALGVIIYQMLTGYVPFKSHQEWQTFHLIINVEFSYPEDIDPVAKDLINNLLKRDPN